MSGTSERVKYELEMECKHTVHFHTPLPKTGERLWCIRCRDFKMITGGLPGAWRIKCQSCKHSREFGRAKLTAEVAATKHRRQKWNAGHVVHLLNGVKLERVFDGRNDPFEITELPGF